MPAAGLGCIIAMFALPPAEGADAPAKAVPADPAPEVQDEGDAKDSRSERDARQEALERLARGEGIDDGAPPDDTLPRNREARLVHVVPPEYPQELAGSGISAEVMVSVMVDRQGKASHVRVEESIDQVFTDAALDALTQWVFEPRIREGRISNSRMRLTVLVSEEVGDRAVHDFPGGRIALENVTYEIEPDTPVRRFFGLRPVYPFAMLVDGKAGEVVVEFSVGDEGLPRDIKVVEATHREFAYAVQGALVHWRFSPAEKAHRSVNARMRYRMSFQPHEIDEAELNLARELRKGNTPGLESARTITQQPRVARSIQPSSYDGTRNAPRRRRVMVEVVVTELGEVRLPRVLSTPDPLSGYIALAAVSYWRFEPALKNDMPVPVVVSLPVTF